MGTHRCRTLWIALVVPAMILLASPVPCRGQLKPAPAPNGDDSVSVAPGEQYAAGGLHQFFFGKTYRELWKTPLRVPVLNLSSFAGGLRPTKLSGGKQTKSLRFVTRDGSEWVFRSVDKDNVVMPPRFEGTVVEAIFRDQVSSSFPAAALVTAPLQEAAGVLHPTPSLAVMPDDPALGEFREEFAGRLGMIEEFPSVPEGAPRGFAGAREIIESEDLLARLNSDPTTRVDAASLLNARLTDMFFNDWDRHFGQWKWARMSAERSGPWIPIARDRDKAFISYSGLVPRIARLAAANIVSFKGTYPSIRGLTFNSIDFDRRLLSSLEKATWDSVTAALIRKLDDAAIERVTTALPMEYRASAPVMIARLKQRRDGLPEAANRFYALINSVVDLHASDENDRAVIRLMTDTVDLSLRGGPGGRDEVFHRRFVAGETGEIRLYLHGGDDHAVIRGQAERSIPLRVIGGNGTNVLVDSAVVGGRTGTVRLYDQGRVEGIPVATDTMFDRRPWIRERGRLVPPGKDRGKKLGPILGIGIHGDFGVMPRFGLSHYQYGFGKRPYARRIALAAQYATKLNAWRIELLVDQRREHSPLHFITLLGMSQLEVIRFHGLGNQTPGPTGADFFDVSQRQWLAQTALGWSLGPKSDIRFGPFVKYVVTDDDPSTFIGANPLYGAGEFGEAGLRLAVHHDVRDQPKLPRKGMLLDLAAAFHPELWDVQSAFGAASASIAGYLTLPVPLHPILAVRASGKKLFGDFPYFEAAFIGGGGSVRNLDAQRFAGDASLAGTAELRLPLASFSFILPLDVGIFGLAEGGRVYLDGASPGGWHSAFGGGFWIGVLDPTSALSFAFTNNQERTGVFIRAGLSF
jgi:hypothetical protein